MKVNTELLRQTSIQLSTNIQNILFDDIHLNNGHARILNHLQQLTNYFNQSAIVLETNEQKLTNSIFQSSSEYKHTETWNFISLLQKKEKAINLSQSYEYALGEASSHLNKKYFKTGISLDIADFLAKGKAQFYLWKDGVFTPKALLEGNISLSLLSGNIYAKLGSTNINAHAKARGDLGVVYGNAKAVLSKEEQTFEFGGGVALAKGEVSLAFNLFGTSIQIKGSGSIGSAELDMSYSHKNREWEFGSKLGFIAGLGFDIKVNY